MSVTAVGPETQVNTNTAGDQTAPQVIALSDGRYDIVWKTATGWSLQLYAADGTAVGGEVAFAGVMPQAFAGLSDGRLAYVDYRYIFNCFYCVLNADGSVSLPRVATWAPTFSSDSPISVSLTANDHGGAVLVFSNERSVQGCTLDPNTGKNAIPIQLMVSTAEGPVTDAHVSVTEEGDFLVTWTRIGKGLEGTFFHNGVLVGDFNRPITPPVSLVGEDHAVTYAEIVDNNGSPDVHIAIYADGGIAAQALIGVGGANPADLNLFELSDHRSLVTWTTSVGADAGSTCVMGAVVTPHGEVGSAFVIATDAAATPSLSFSNLDGTQFALSWQSTSIDGVGQGIAVRTFDAGAFDPTTLSGGNGPENWVGGALSDIAKGNGGADSLAGNAGDDTLQGGSGNDSLRGGAGNDKLDGGADQDTAYFSHGRTSYVVTQAGDTFTIMDKSTTGGDGIDKVTGVETFVFDGVSLSAANLLNVAPVAVNDSNAADAVVEPGAAVTGDTLASGNALSNDTDANVFDTLTVIGVRAGTESDPSPFANIAFAAQGQFGSLRIDAAGHWTYELNDALSATNSLTVGQTAHDVFTYQVTDIEGKTDTAVIDVQVSGSNDAPVFPGFMWQWVDATVAEGSTFVRVEYAEDPEGSAVTYSIAEGVDGNLFIINPTTGELSLRRPADYEHPHYEYGASGYAVIVKATDASGLSTTQVVSVKLTDVPDTPVIAGAPEIPSHSPVNAITWNYVAPTTINVFFAEAGVSVTDYYQGKSNGTFAAVGWTSSEKEAAASIFAQYQAVAGVHFNVVTSIDQADFVMAKNPGNAGTAVDAVDAYWDIGANRIEYGNKSLVVEGIGVFNLDSNRDGKAGGAGDYWSAASLQPGGYAYAILAHEIGHGLGLAHPHDNGGGSEIMDGVTAPNVTGDYDLNQGIYTTMTYNDGWPFEPGVNTQWQPGASTFAYGWQAGPMALDIAALQRKYGSNPDHNGGDTVYVLPDSNASGTAFTAIWDTGGTDTIRYNGARDVTISLIAATLDYSWTGGGDPSYANGVRGGFTIAAGVVIENAIGGSGNDWLVGNSAHNIFDGGAGSDLADYQSESGALTITLNGASDATVYVDGVAEDILRSIEELAGGSAGDVFTGDATDNWFVGGGGKDILDGGAGNDWVSYREKAESVVVALNRSAWSDVTVGGVVEDQLRNVENVKGGWGNDGLTGDGWANILWGVDGNDTLWGMDGDDLLKGGAGNDSLDGGAGNDTADFSDAAVKVVVVLAGGSATSTIGSEHDMLAGIENLSGGSAGDALTGDGGANTLFGNGSNDTLNGGAGNDTLKGGAGNDSLVGGTGIDIADFSDKTAKVTLTLKSGAGSATIGTEKDALTGIEWLAGGSAGDALTGDTGANKIWGNGGADTLVGGSGNDTLYGGAGSDRLDGGAGADRFVFDIALSAAGNVDSIVKFEHGSDRMMLDATLFAGVGASLVASELYIASGAVAAHDADDRIVYDKKTGWLYYDDDGLGGDAAVHFATLLNKPTTLTYVDFQIA